MSDALVWSILIPLLGAILTFWLNSRWVAAIGLAFSLATGSLALRVAYAIWRDGAVLHEIGGWGAPLGIDLYADGLSAFMLATNGLVGLLISAAAYLYFEPKEDGPRQGQERRAFWPLWLFLWGALNLAYVSSDAFNLYVAVELIGLAGVALIVVTGGRDGMVAAMRYLLAALLGSLGYLLGVAMLYGEFHTLDLRLMAELSAEAESSLVLWVALALISVGLMVKTALFPLHFWLPPAHSSAAAPVSAVLSALVVKATFYLLLRLWFGVFSDQMTVSFGQLFGVLATLAIIGGSVQAILQRRLKIMVAYSTVAHIGYLFLILPLTIPYRGNDTAAWNFDGFSGGMYHLLSHALAKSAMFLAAGIVILSMGNDRLRNLRGMAHQLPLTTFAFGLAGVSLMGLPPSGGFVAKWFMVNAAIESSQWWWVIVLLAGGLLTAVYVFLVLRYAFLPAHPPHFRAPPRRLEYVALTLAVLSLAIGFRAVEAFELLEAGTPFLTAPDGGDGS